MIDQVISTELSIESVQLTALLSHIETALLQVPITLQALNIETVSFRHHTQISGNIL